MIFSPIKSIQFYISEIVVIVIITMEKKYTPNTLPLPIMMLSGGVAASIA